MRVYRTFWIDSIWTGFIVTDEMLIRRYAVAAVQERSSADAISGSCVDVQSQCL